MSKHFYFLFTLCLLYGGWLSGKKGVNVKLKDKLKILEQMIKQKSCNTIDCGNCPFDTKTCKKGYGGNPDYIVVLAQEEKERLLNER